MEILKNRIISEGKSLDGGVLKVDSFINHQMDANLMFKMAEEFAERFKDCMATKIITVEASGIAPAIFVGYLMNLPVLFVKKKNPKTMVEMYTTTVHSFTKDREYTLSVSKEYIKANDKLIFIDDFLAGGNAANAIIDLAKQSGANIVAMGFLIEKSFQKGGDTLREKGYNVHSLAVIDDLRNNKIILRD